MKRLTNNLFLAGNNVFNSQTLEVFTLTDEYINTLEGILSNRQIDTGKSHIKEELEKSGIFDRGSLITSETSFSPDLVAFRIVLGEVCNLNCKGCFVMIRDHAVKCMSSRVLIQLLKKTFTYAKERQIKYHFFGGEPLMMTSLLKQAIEQIESAVNNGEILKPILTITTNGTLLTDELASYLSLHGFEVGVSIDGPETINDFIRGAGSYKRLMQGYNLLEKYDVKRWFLITPRQENINQLSDFTSYLTNTFHLKSLTINTPFDGRNLAWDINGKELADRILECYRLLKNHGVVIECAVSPVLYALSSGIKRIYPCSISDQEVMASIACDGRISYCAQYWGNDMFHQKITGDYRLNWQYTKPKQCNLCIASNLCGGPCPISFYKTGKLDLEKCAFYTHLLAILLERPEDYLSDGQLLEESI